jgi:manganese transport protein
LITRGLAIIPAVIVITLSGDQGTYKLLILSQVILSLQLPFAVVPLVKFTSSRQRMGKFVSPLVVSVIAWVVASIIILLNARLVLMQISEWTEAAGSLSWLVWGVAVPIVVGLAGLLIYIVLKRDKARPLRAPVTAEEVLQSAGDLGTGHKRIGVALEATEADSTMLAEAIALARVYRADLYLFHIVEGVGGQWYGSKTADLESREDHTYLESLATRLRGDLTGQGIGEIQVALGYGNVTRELVKLVRQHSIDFLVVGGHGHKGLSDLLHGDTISGVRHGLSIPVLAIRNLPEKPPD